MMAICEILKTMFKYHVVKELRDRFGQTLPILTIEHAASFCEFDINEATNLLVRISTEMQDDDQESSEMVACVDLPAVRRVEAAQYSPTFVSSGAIPEKSQKTLEIERVISRIKLGFKVVVILRGLPGSGKSYLAKKITEATLGSCDVDNQILSTDDYFKTPSGYDYDPFKIRVAHQWNRARASKAMSRGISPVIIDNTNCQMYEMKPYATTAMDYGYFVEILEPDTWWSFDAVELAKRNVRRIHKSKIKAMIARYDRNITTVKWLSGYVENPAQFHTQPPVEMTRQVQNDGRSKRVLKKAEKSPPNSHVNFDTDASASGLAFKNVDLLDLIDFDTEVNQDGKALYINTTTNESNNLVDQMMLMCPEDVCSGILQPEVLILENNLITFDDTKVNHNNGAFVYSILDESNCPIDEMIFMCPEDDCSSVLQPEIPRSKLDIHKLYDEFKVCGLDKEAVQSWDMVAHLKRALAGPLAQESFATFSEVAKENELNEIGTSIDPDIIMHITKGEIPEGFKVLRGTSRNKSSGSVSRIPSCTPEKSMHDKSCWTDDYMNDDTEDETDIQPLSGFPSLRRSYSYMKHLYNRYFKKSNTAMNGLVKNHGHVDDSKIDSNESDAGSLTAQNHDGRSSSVEPLMRKTTTSEHAFEKTVLLEKASDVDVDEKHESDEQPDIELADKSSSPSIVDNAEDSPDEGFYDSHEGNTKYSVELNLDEGFSAQLEAKFEFLEHVQGFQSVIKKPVQLMDAQKQVLEQVEKQDEECVRKLQSKEDKLVQSQRGISSNEILDEQIAANNHKGDADPILEILHFVQASISSDVSIEPNEAQQICANIPKALTETQKIYQAAFYHREKANMHFNRRVRLYQEAHGHYQRGLTAFAMIHSDLVAKESQLLEKANNFAINLFLKEQSMRLQDDYTLDLHHLYVKEAIAVLDVFVDKNISALQDRSSDVHRLLCIITGRGNHSRISVPKIKPAVIDRLKKRDIKVLQMNLGELKIQVTRDTRLCCDCPA